MRSAEITDAAAKLEEQRRRNRLAQRRRRERQRNRAASISSDPLSTILSDDHDQQSSEKTWEFAVDSAFFDASLQSQDEIVDQCLRNSPPISTDVDPATEQAAAAEPASLVANPDANSKGLLNRPLSTSNVSGNSASLESSSPSPLHQFLMTLQRADGGRQPLDYHTDASVLTFSPEISPDSCARLLAMFPQTQLSQNPQYDGPAHKFQQPVHASDFMQLGSNASACYSTTGGSSIAASSQDFPWPRSESRPSAGSHSATSTAQDISFERIRAAAEDAGFESLEAMMVAYYSANLNASSPSRPAQAVGRSRRLRGFLSAIHRSHTAWGEQERTAYREEIVRAAEGIYADELSNMVHGATDTSGSKMLSIAGSSKPTAETSRVYIAHRIQSLVSDQDIQDFMRKDRKDLQDTVADTWSLITQLIHNTGQSPQQKASNACIILYLLTSPVI